MTLEQSVGAVEPLKVTSHGHRFYSEEHKRAVVEKCLAPGASLSAVALAHGFNANLVRRWVDRHRQRLLAGKGSKLLPVAVKGKQTPKRRAYRRRSTGPTAVSSIVTGVIELELGTTKIVLRGDVDRAQLRTVLETLAQIR